MSDQVLARVDILRRVGEERPVGEDRQRCVLHAAGDEVLHDDLIVLVPGVRDADFLLVEGEHVGGALEAVGRLSELRRRRVETQRDVSVPRFELLEIPGDQRDQVVDVGLLLEPVNGLEARLRVDSLGYQPAVRNDRHLGRNVADDLGAESFVRVVEVREPVRRIVTLALREQVRVRRRVSHCRRAEVKPLPRLGIVHDRDGVFLAGQQGRTEGDLDVFVGRRVARDLGVRHHRGNIQVNGVELQLGQEPRDRRKADSCDAPDRTLLEVRRHVDGHPDDIDVARRCILAVRRVLRLCRRTGSIRAREPRQAPDQQHRKTQESTARVSFCIHLVHLSGRCAMSRQWFTVNMGEYIPIPPKRQAVSFCG